MKSLEENPSTSLSTGTEQESPPPWAMPVVPTKITKRSVPAGASPEERQAALDWWQADPHNRRLHDEGARARRHQRVAELRAKVRKVRAVRCYRRRDWAAEFEQTRKAIRESSALRRPAPQTQRTAHSGKRAPRRSVPVRRAATKKTSSAGASDGGGDGPGDDAPQPLLLPLAPTSPKGFFASIAAVVTDAPAMADILAATLGLTPRQLRALVEERGIRHSRRHAGARHILVRVDDVLAALGLGSEPAPRSEAAPTEPEEPGWDEAAVIKMASRARRQS